MKQTNMFSVGGRVKFISQLLASLLLFLLLLSPIAPVFAEESTAESAGAGVNTGASNNNSPSDASVNATALENTLNAPDGATPAALNSQAGDNTNDKTNPPDGASPAMGSAKSAMALSSAAQPLYSENMTVSLTENTKDVLETDETTGALNYSFPISVPPGRNGLQPNLQLNYNNQQAGNYPNLLGYGWNINIPYIDRINKLGTDKLYTSNYFNSSLSGELVLVSGTTYVPKVENGDFLTYTYDGASWIVKDKKGVTYKFGQNTQSRQDDSAGAKIYKWMLEEIRDTNSNYVTYTYFKDAGQIYPSAINYSGIFEVEFLRETRLDINKSYATTFLVQTNYRINKIQTKVNGVWVRKYAMGYTSGDNGVRSLLASITESGQDENLTVTTLPATVFGYQTHTSGWIYDTSANFPENFNTGSWDGGARIGDINSDGLSDVLLARSGGISGRKVYINKGANRWVFDPSLVIPEDFVWIPADNGLRPVDVDSDGFLDLLFSKTGSPQKTYLNTGANFSPNPSWILPEFFIEQNGEDKGVRIADINADGLPDVLVAQDSNIPANKIYINTGSGFSFDSSWTIPEFFLAGRYDNGVRMGDVNGDGLVDILLSRDGIRKTYLNTGSGWTLDPSWTIPEDFVWFPYDKGLRLADINGDGMADLLYARSGASRQVFINTGSSFANNPSWTIPEDFIEGTTSTQTMIDDSDGDGLADLIRADEYASPRKVYKANSKFPDLLSSIIFPQGATASVSYKPSTQYKDQNGNLLNPSLPLIIQTVEKIETNDGFDNKSVVSYEYSGGSYFYNTAIDKKFAGFSKVIKTDSVGNKATTYFHQGNITNDSQGEYSDNASKIGKIYRTEISDSSGNIYSKTINKWDDFDLGSGSRFVKLAQTVNYTYDGDSIHKDKAEAYTYDNTNGNLISKINYGEVSGADDGTFVDVGNDKFTENISYAANILNYVIGLPSQDTMFDQVGNKIKESKMYYDGLDLGSVGAGNQTKTENWKSGAEYTNSQKIYNSFGLVTSVIDPRDKATNYVYDSYNLYPAIVTDPLGHTIQYQYDYSSGKIKQITDQNGFVYQTTYDGLGRVLQENIPDLVSPYSPVLKTQYFYTDTPNNVSIQKIDYDGTNTIDTYQYFDGLNRLIQERKETETMGVFSVRDIAYNNVGLVLKESLRYASNGEMKTSPTSDNTLYINYIYDPIQRILTTSNAVGTTNYTYNGWKTTVTDPNGKQKNYYQDAYANLVKVEEINAGNIYTTNYQYDGNKNLTKITDALSNIRNFTYDGLNRKLTAEDLHATSDTTFGTYTYTYDDANNLIQTINPKSETVNYTYDELNRVLTEDDTGKAGIEINYTYDTGINGIGKLASVILSGSSANYSYNSFGIASREIKNIDSTNYQTDYAYDKLGNQTLITNPDNSQIKYIYNTAGLLNQVQRKESTDPSFTDVVSNLDYSPTEQITSINFANSITTTNTYDAMKLYRLNRRLSQNITTNLQDLNYTYDNVGNITKLIDASNTDTKKTADYIYDDLNRLTSATITAVAAGQDPYTENYTYSPIGNILTKNGSQAFVYGGNVGANYANPHAVTSINGVTNTYDNNGNLLSDGTLTNTWNYKNQLVKTVVDGKTTTYDYDQNGQRIKQTTGTTTTYYPSKYYNIDSNGKITKHIYANGILIADITSGTPLGGTTPSCAPPETGDWIISTSCTYTGIALAPASVIVNANKVLTITDGSKLLIDFKHYKLLVKYTGGVLIKKGATLRQVKTADLNTTPTIAYLLTDHLNSTTIITDQAGNIINTTDYYPYGTIRIDKGTGKEQRKYIGQIFDQDSGLNYLQARYYQSTTGRFISQDPVFWEIGQTEDGKKALLNPQSQNSYSYAGNNPITFSDPDGRWYKEFLSGQQSWSSFSGEVGEATQYMSGGWQTVMDHPYVPAVVGSLPLAGYGAVAVIAQAQVGVNLGRLSELPMNPRVDNIVEKGFDAIQKATGLTKTEAIQTIQNTGRSLVEMRPRNLGNINNLANVGEKVIRITTTPNASKIISAGVINGASKVANYVSSGAMRAIPTVTSIAKTVTKFISNLVK